MIGTGVCACGCGRATQIAKDSNPRCGDVAGKPRRYVRGHHGRGKRLASTNHPKHGPTAVCACGCGTSLAGRFAITKYVNNQHGFEAALVEQGHPRHGERTCPCGCGGQPRLGSVWIKGHGTRKSGYEYIVDAETGCWMWQRSIAKDGYPGTALDAAGKQVRAYRMVYERECGPIPEGHHIHHICETPRCVNPDHLRPVTPEEHARLHGRSLRLMTAAMLSDARSLIANGMSQRATAKRLGVSRSQLRRRLGLTP